VDTKDHKADFSSPETFLPDNAGLPAIPKLGDTFQGATGIPMPSEGEPPSKSPTALSESLRRLRRDKRATSSIVIIVIFIVVSLLGPFIYQHMGDSGSFSNVGDFSTGILLHR
jgi:oligopeptide transport system permease protein